MSMNFMNFAPMSNALAARTRFSFQRPGVECLAVGDCLAALILSK